ncbi:MAG: 5-formyltetrahydrofolate cyclo-ligase [Planctomycetaceae bacterium]|jgi:5-formyltetrahydrofolate cyclo-ligase|nr:5-formyltetrahydrofolate cyclo-ligase [Planctomycetaceae bacterium]
MTLTKEEIRRIVAERKKTFADTQTLSQLVVSRLMKIPEMTTAKSIMTYIDFDKEVCTMPVIVDLLQKGCRVVVPYCEQNEIRLFLLRNVSELDAGQFGILEPKIELRKFSERGIQFDELQITIVPALAFDPNGGRVGRGRGYYDRFLQKLPEAVVTIGLGFDFQIFDKVPMYENDCFLKIVVSETKTYIVTDTSNKICL